MLRLYFAAPFLDAPAVRDLDIRLALDGIQATSRWAHEADGPEALHTLPLREVRQIARTNDRDLLSAHLVVALPRDAAGAEMFAEVRLALAHRIPVLWVGARRPLSAYREGVHRVASVEDGVSLLHELREVVAALPAYDVRRARELVWSVVEALEGAGERGTSAEVA